MVFTIDSTSTPGACVLSEEKVSATKVSEAKVTFQSAGSCKIDANQAGDEEWKAALQVQNLVVVNPKPQTITFAPPPTPVLVGGATVVEATAQSGEAVVFTIDSTSTPGACVLSEEKVSATKVSEAKVTFQSAGSCKIDANQAGNGKWEAALQVQNLVVVNPKPQTITFAPPPTPVLVGGATVVEATAQSGEAVVFTIDSTSTPGACVLSEEKVSATKVSEAKVTFQSAGSCKIDANQAGNGKWEAAQQVQNLVVINPKPQTIQFTTSPPASATVGGSPYTVSATGGGSGNPVTFTIDGVSSAVCSISASTVSFVGAGTCTIDANQAEDANYNAAPPAQQSFSVAAAPKSNSTSSGTSTPDPTPTPIVVVSKPAPPKPPNSNFAAIAAAYNPASGGITFTESVSDPGTFSWLFTFQNGKYGVFAASKSKCKAGFVRLHGKCRPARVVFAKGKQTVATVGSVSFTVKPTAADYRALKNAAKRNKGLPVTATITFQSAHGGSPVSRTQLLILKLQTN